MSQEASWQQRALNAEDALKAVNREIGTQRAHRERIAILLGQIRDLETEYPQETVHRIITGNSSFKQRLREVTNEARSLAEKLQAARSNNRFLDKRVGLDPES